MPRVTRDDRTVINVLVPTEAKDALDKLAEEDSERTGKRVYAADLAREALAAYFKKRKVKASVEVSRGGYRLRDSDDD
jgi:hypothetical protein